MAISDVNRRQVGSIVPPCRCTHPAYDHCRAPQCHMPPDDGKRWWTSEYPVKFELDQSSRRPCSV